MVVAEKRGVGQPPVVLTDEEEHDYLTAVENGASNRGAAEEAGIGYWITRRMYATDSEFSAKVDTASSISIAFIHSTSNSHYLQSGEPS